MNRNWSMLSFVGCSLALLGLHCNQQKPAPDTRAADEAAIHQTDIAWFKVAAAKQLDGLVAYYADDAIVLPPNEPMATGKEAIRKVWAELFSVPGVAITWQPTKVEAARSGDIGYSVGTYEITMTDPEGKPMTDHGKYLSVWKKQADGSWKSVVDTWNSDLPALPPSK